VNSRTRWRSTSATRWLRFLARRLVAQRSYDITWSSVAGIVSGRIRYVARMAAGAGVVVTLFAGSYSLGLGETQRGLTLFGLAALLLTQITVAVPAFSRWPDVGIRPRRKRAFLASTAVAILVGAAAQSAAFSTHEYDLVDATRHGAGPGIIAGIGWFVLCTTYGR
jgi:hypothetical protein